MATNREIVIAEGIEQDVDSLMDFALERICRCCQVEIPKNISPTSPACEGRWCEEACELWLDAEEGSYGPY